MSMEILYATAPCLSPVGERPHCDGRSACTDPRRGAHWERMRQRTGEGHALCHTTRLFGLPVWEEGCAKMSEREAFCGSPKQALRYLLSSPKEKEKRKKMSPQRHGPSCPSLFRDPATLTIPGGAHSLLPVGKEGISRLWKLHAP